MKLVRVLGAVAATFGLVITASPANAAIGRHGDAVGDVRAFRCTNPLDESTCTEFASKSAEPDITTIAIRNESANVVVRIKQRDVTQGWIRAHELRIVTNEGRTRMVDTLAAPGSVRMSKEMTRPDGSHVRCTGLKATMDQVLNLVTITVPRSCLGYPGWVRVGIGAFTSKPDGTVMLADDAFLDGRVADRLVLSPIVRRL